MASIGHVAVGLAAARAYEQGRTPRWTAMLGWSALSLFPDIDVAGFLRGVPYGAPWGHRGATHSLTFALAGAILVSAVNAIARGHGRLRGRTFAFASLVLASHGVLDAMTDGGLGPALLWPFSLARFFAPWRPITVAPIGADFFTPYGAVVAASEVILFAPLLVYALWPRGVTLRFGATAAAVLVWFAASWLIVSGDPVRERVLGAVMHDGTRYGDGYSEQFFRTILVGDREDAVRGRLGEPLSESLFFAPKDWPFRSAMEVSVAQLPHDDCVGVRMHGGLVEEAIDAKTCGNRGIVPGLTRADVTRVLGTPSESCAEYTESPTHGHFRMRMVCFLHGEVEGVFRRWI